MKILSACPKCKNGDLLINKQGHLCCAHCGALYELLEVLLTSQSREFKREESKFSQLFAIITQYNAAGRLIFHYRIANLALWQFLHDWLLGVLVLGVCLILIMLWFVRR